MTVANRVGRWMALPDVAASLGVSLSTVRRLVASGEIPARRVSPRLLRVNTDEFQIWLDSRQTVAGERAEQRN